MSASRWLLSLTAVVAMSLGTGSHALVFAEESAAETVEGEVDSSTALDDHGSSHASEAGHSGEHHDPYDLSTANAGDNQESMFELRSELAIATFVVFLLLLAILGKFAWGPIATALDQREEGIAHQLAEAKRNQEDTARLLAEHERKLAAASEEVRGLLDQARRDGDTVKQRMIAEAEQSAATQKARAIQEIEAAKNGALEELARHSVQQAVTLASSIVGRELKTDDHTRLVQESLQRLPSRN